MVSCVPETYTWPMYVIYVDMHTAVARIATRKRHRGVGYGALRDCVGCGMRTVYIHVCGTLHCAGYASRMCLEISCNWECGLCTTCAIAVGVVDRLSIGSSTWISGRERFTTLNLSLDRMKAGAKLRYLKNRESTSGGPEDALFIKSLVRVGVRVMFRA